MIQENIALTLQERKSGKSEGAFRTISEVAEELDVPQHVLRFWESRFSQIRPLKRGGNRRYYRPEDVLLLYRIRDLLYKEGYTIKGVQRILKGSGVKGILESADLTPDKNASPREQEFSFDLPNLDDEEEEELALSLHSSIDEAVLEAPASHGEKSEKRSLPKGELREILSELLDLKKLLGESIR